MCINLSEEAVVDVLDDARLLVELPVVLSVQLRPAHKDIRCWTVAVTSSAETNSRVLHVACIMQPAKYVVNRRNKTPAA